MAAAGSTRKIRVVVAKPGLDGHDRGAKIIARALRDAGMEVIYTGLHQTPEQIVETVIQEDADAVGLSILSGAHMTLVPRVVELLREQEAGDVIVTVGGTIPAQDIPELKQLGRGRGLHAGRADRGDHRLHPRRRHARSPRELAERPTSGARDKTHRPDGTVTHDARRRPAHHRHRRRGRRNGLAALLGRILQAAALGDRRPRLRDVVLAALADPQGALGRYDLRDLGGRRDGCDRRDRHRRAGRAGDRDQARVDRPDHRRRDRAEPLRRALWRDRTDGGSCSTRRSA